MKRFICALIPLALMTGCANIPVPASPSSIATHTVADEQALLRCEQGYKLSRTVGELGVDAGLIRGSATQTAAALDGKLYATLQTCRTAYRAFNSTDLISATNEIARLGDQVQALVKGAAK